MDLNLRSPKWRKPSRSIKHGISLFWLLAVTSYAGSNCASANSREFTAQWSRVAVSSLTTITYPRDNFTELGRISASRTGSGFDLQLLRGNRWITLGREEAGALGLRAGDISNVLRQPRVMSSTIFALYSPADNELRVHVSRMEKRNDGTIRSALADFTPHHGERWAAARMYLTRAEGADPHRAGHNPFARFRGATNDPVFSNIGWPAAQVAVGLAMKHYDAHAALIAVMETRIDSRTEESGNIFRRRVETTTTAYTQPRWFIALPEFAQPYGFSAAICVSANATDTACDAPEHIARSNVSVVAWEGGSLPSSEENIAEWRDTRSGWSILSMALGGITAASMLGLDPGSALLIANAIDPVSDYMESDGIAFSNGTRGSLTGAAGSGTPVGHGSAVAASPSSPEDAELRARLRARTRDPIDAGFVASRQAFVGNCPVGTNESECARAGLQPGMLRRAANPTQMSPTRRLQAAEALCRDRGYSGSALARCAALSRAPVITD